MYAKLHGMRTKATIGWCEECNLRPWYACAMRILSELSLDMERAERDPNYCRRVRNVRRLMLAALYVLPLLFYVAIDHQKAWWLDESLQIVSFSLGVIIAARTPLLGGTWVMYGLGLALASEGAFFLANASAMLATGERLYHLMFEYFYPVMMLMAPIGMVMCGVVAGRVTRRIGGDDYLLTLMEHDRRLGA
jgi:hypothetical protein